MPAYQLDSPDDPRFTEFARRFGLHPLHVEDAQSPGERVKVESAPHYVFALLKTINLPEHDQDLDLDTISLFASRPKDLSGTGDLEHSSSTEPFLLIVGNTRKPDVASALRRIEGKENTAPPTRLLYLIFDAVVDSYFPIIDRLDDQIDKLEDRVIDPEPRLVNDIFSVKRRLVDTRRLLVSTRDAAMHLQRDAGLLQNGEEQIYLRDLYDHTARLLDTVETQRDLLNNALDIYLSSVANRTNEVMKVLTVLSTIALPALVVSGIYGMNIKGLPFMNSPWGAEEVAAVTLGITGALLVLLRRWSWL